MTTAKSVSLSSPRQGLQGRATGDETFEVADAPGFRESLAELMGSDHAVGWHESVMVRPGFSVEASEWQFQREQAFQFRGDDKLKFHFKLSGRSTLRLEDGGSFDVKSGRMSYLIHPEDALKQEYVPSGTTDRSITFVCTRDFSNSILEEYLGDLPKCVRAFVSGKSDWMAAGSVAMPDIAWPVVEALLRPEPRNALQGVMYEARALELLHHALANIMQDRPSSTFVRARDRKRVEDACVMLEDTSGPPMSISQMSRLLAWNETQMMECFKQVTGTTISGYRNRVRMTHALHELKTTDLSVTEIAFNAGYDYPGNFTAAFKRTFGFSPRAARSSTL